MRAPTRTPEFKFAPRTPVSTFENGQRYDIWTCPYTAPTPWLRCQSLSHAYRTFPPRSVVALPLAAQQICRDRLVAACSAAQSQESCQGCHDDGARLIQASQAPGRQQTGRMHTPCCIEGHDTNINPG